MLRAAGNMRPMLSWNGGNGWQREHKLHWYASFTRLRLMCFFAAAAADCSSAPNCAALHRCACFDVANTCGPCLPGHMGDQTINGYGNTLCLGNWKHETLSQAWPGRVYFQTVNINNTLVL